MTGVMGFVAQCEICPQKAILTDQLSAWICPRCTEVAEPTVAQLVSVVLSDGTIRTERGHFDPLSGQVVVDGVGADPDMVRRAQRTIAEISAWADRLTGEGGFGDIDVAAAEPVAVNPAVPPPPQPLTIPMSDPLAAAIVREVAQRPDRPLITALVGGRTFQFTGYTQRRGEPLETVWINEADLRTNLGRLREPIIWGAPVDEPELPYKPPVKDHAFRAPVVPMSQGVIDDNEAEGRKLDLHINGLLAHELLAGGGLVAGLLDDDDYPLGRIQG